MKIRKEWTPEEADEWTKEDWITILFSSLAYILLMVGVGLSLLLMWQGYVLLVLGVISTIIMHKVIDPKLKVISENYEKQQREYLADLEKSLRWED